MPSYDPQRSRPRPRAAEDEGPAPVDEILGPTTSPDVPTETPSRNGSSPDATATESPRADEADGSVGTDESEGGDGDVRATIPGAEAQRPAGAVGPPPAGVPRVVVVAIVGAVVLIVGLLWRRRRRSVTPEPE